VVGRSIEIIPGTKKKHGYERGYTCEGVNPVMETRNNR